MKTFWKAACYSSRAGRKKKVLMSCQHRHRDEGAAGACANKMERIHDDPRRYWTTMEIVLAPVGSRLPDGKIVR
jgi:hypothetical protein